MRLRGSGLNDYHYYFGLPDSTNGIQEPQNLILTISVFSGTAVAFSSRHASSVPASHAVADAAAPGGG